MRIDRVTKRYGAATVLDAVTLELPDNAYVALLGPSGSGKSTLLRCIAGLITPDEGRIEPYGDKPPEQRHIGMVFQSYAVWPHMSVGQNVAYRGSVDAAKKALERVGLGTFYDRDPATLSGGQQQRVALARALAMKPSALLLDEPLANLDPHLRADLCDELRQLHAAEPRTFIHVTHDREEALGLATYLVVLKDGRVEQAGPTEDVFTQPRSAFVAEFVAGAVRHGEHMLADLRPGGELRAEVLSVAYAGTHYVATVRLGAARTRVKLQEKPGSTVMLSAQLKWAL